MLRRTQIVSLVFERSGFEVVKFYICQHKICAECSVFLLPEYVIQDDDFDGVAGQGKINDLIFSTTLSNQCCQHSYYPK
jgi:hypothetical protein